MLGVPRAAPHCAKEVLGTEPRILGLPELISSIPESIY